MGQETMSVGQVRWAAAFRTIPAQFQEAIASVSEDVLQHRPGEGEWSAVEIVDHMVDKTRLWGERLERIVAQERPFLAGYDQDEYVRAADYQHGHPSRILEDLQLGCERLAAIVERLPDEALEREGVHGETGPITLRQCIELPLESVPDHLAQLRAALADAAHQAR